MNGENSASFEYDEDVEAYGAEADESEADETFEADETWEADEGDGEADEGSDELAFEASDEADESEADEGSDEVAFEADEADEAVVTAAARLQATQDRNRRSAWARRIATDQRVEAQRLAGVQRSITSRIRAIQPGPTAKVATVGSLQGAGVVTAILPNGRRSRMRIMPTVAPISEVNRLRNVVQVNERRQAVATARNSKAISSLGSAQAAAVKQLTAQQLKSDKDLGRRLVEGHNRLDKRITKELSGGSGSLDKNNKRLMKQLKRQRQRSLMNSVLLATSAPFFAAYGEKSEPWARNNLILTLPLLGLMLGDEVLDRVAGKSKAARGLATAWSYGAPVANGLTAYFALRNKQHERFVVTETEVAVVSAVAAGPHTGAIELKNFVASGDFASFKTKDHVVVALRSPGQAGVPDLTNVQLSGDREKIELTFGAAFATKVKIFFVIDTHEKQTATA